MLFTTKKSFLYKKILITLLMLSFNTFSYGKNEFLADKLKKDDIDFEYINISFNPVQASSTYFKYSIKNFNFSRDSLINILKNKDFALYFDFGTETPVHKYINYTLGVNILIYNKNFSSPRISLDPLVGIKFKAPHQLKNLYIAPYIHFMYGPSIFIPDCKINTDPFQAVPDIYRIIKNPPKFTIAGVFAAGIDIYINEWIGIFGEIQKRFYKYPEHEITYRSIINKAFIKHKFSKTDYETDFLFVFGMRTTF